MTIDIPKHATDPSQLIRQRVYTRAARDAFGLLLQQLAPHDGRPLLLPAYIGWSPHEGSGLLDPIETSRTAFAFYPLNERLHADLDAIRSLLEETAAFAVLVVHYFGFPEPRLAALQALCREAGATLIEDCAHCLEPRGEAPALGETGDYSFFSVHKVLPTRAGGYLQINAGTAPRASSAKDIRMDPSDLETLCSADTARIAQRRRERFAELLPLISQTQGVAPLHDALPSGVVPLNFPLRVTGADRYEVYQRLRAQGVGAIALYHTLVTAIAAERFPVSHALSRDILNLPIHQDVAAAQLPSMVERLAAALTG